MLGGLGQPAILWGAGCICRWGWHRGTAAGAGDFARQGWRCGNPLPGQRILRSANPMVLSRSPPPLPPGFPRRLWRLWRLRRLCGGDFIEILWKFYEILWGEFWRVLVERGRGMGYNVEVNRRHVDLGYCVGRRELGYYVGSWGRGC